MKVLRILLTSLFALSSSLIIEQDAVKSLDKPKEVLQEEDDIKIDRGQRANPYANTPSYAQGGDTSRYSTSQGWSRGRGHWWWGGRGSDMPTSGYTAPSNK